MKKQLLLILVLLFSSFVLNAQNIPLPKLFPTGFGKFTFPLGSKIVLELKAVNKTNYEYKVLSVEPIKGLYSFKEDKDLFSKNVKKNTIEIYFMGAYYNEGKEDKDYKSLLLMRNNLDFPLNYKASIKYYFSPKFENTSIVRAYPGSKTREIWAHKIDYITIYDFEKNY